MAKMELRKEAQKSKPKSHYSTYNMWVILLMSTHEILNLSAPIILKLHGRFISTGCNEYEYNVDIKLIPFEICSIHNFRIICQNLRS